MTPLGHDALIGLAALRVEEGEILSALELFLFILQHPASTQAAKSRAEKLRTAIESQLTTEQIDTIHAQMQHRTLESLAQEVPSKP